LELLGEKERGGYDSLRRPQEQNDSDYCFPDALKK
jgi:hypothetical protein